MLHNSILRMAAWAAVSSASLAHAQQAAFPVQSPQPAAVVPVVAAPAQVTLTPQSVALPAVSAPATVVHPVPGVNSLTGTITPRPTVAVTSTIPQAAMAQQTQIYTPTYYYYYYSPPYQVPAYPAAAYQMNWQSMTVAPVSPMAPIAMSPGYNMFNTGYSGQFGTMFNARGEAGHVRYPYYSYRRPWYYPGQPNFNVTIPGPVW